MRILVCDDEEPNVTRWIGELQAIGIDGSGATLSGLTDLKDAVVSLEARRVKARSGETVSTYDGPFDEVDILIVDYDLLHVDTDRYLTGEGIAYLARCYSRCGLIVVVNQYGANSFDLTLRGHPGSFADLNIGGDQVGNAGLWGQNHIGFRPWSWPVLPDLVGRMKRRCDVLRRGALDASVANVLGFSAEFVESLPRGAIAFLEGEKRFAELTFRDVATSALRRKDALIDEDAQVRVAAARVGKWCERLILPEQDLVIDAPHLVSRYPSLIGAVIDDVSRWNEVAAFSEHFGWKSAVPCVQAAAVPSDDWFSRPVWFGRAVSGCKELPEVSDPWSAKAAPFVFCEDISRFLPADAAKEFVALVDSPFVRRFVAAPDHPMNAAMTGELSNVEYQPAVQFSVQAT